MTVVTHLVVHGSENPGVARIGPHGMGHLAPPAEPHPTPSLPVNTGPTDGPKGLQTHRPPPEPTRLVIHLVIHPELSLRGGR